MVLRMLLHRFQKGVVQGVLSLKLCLYHVKYPAVDLPTLYLQSLVNS